MWFSICEKVVSNLLLPGGSLRALRLPPPPKTDIPYPPILPSIAFILYRQTFSMHVKTQQNWSEVDRAYSELWEYQDNW